MKVKGISVFVKEFNDLTKEDYEVMRKLEHNEKLDKIGDKLREIEEKLNENEYYVAISPSIPNVTIVLKDEIPQKELDKVYMILRKIGYEPKLKGIGYIDDRYFTDNKFKGFAVSLPDDYIDKEIEKFFKRNGLDYELHQNIDGNVVIYECDLGFQELLIMANEMYIGGGLKNYNTHISMDKSKYKKIIKGIEKDYLDWRSKHPDIVC